MTRRESIIYLNLLRLASKFPKDPKLNTLKKEFIGLLMDFKQDEYYRVNHKTKIECQELLTVEVR